MYITFLPPFLPSIHPSIPLNVYLSMFCLSVGVGCEILCTETKEGCPISFFIFEAESLLEPKAFLFMFLCLRANKYKYLTPSCRDPSHYCSVNCPIPYPSNCVCTGVILILAQQTLLTFKLSLLPQLFNIK